VSEASIDAGKLIEERAAKRVEEQRDRVNDGVLGERGSVDLRSGRRPTARGARAFVAIMVGLGALVAVAMTVKAHHLLKENGKASKPPGRIEKKVPSLALETRRSPAEARAAGDGKQAAPLVQRSVTGTEGLAERAATPASPSGMDRSPAPSALALATPPGPDQHVPESPLARRLARGFGGTAEEGGLVPAPQGDAASASPAAPEKIGSLEEKLEPTELRATSATLMTDRDYWLTQGATLDCVLETKLISTVSGMVSCFLTRNVYSTNGRVVLLDRGTKLVGRYQGGVQQGEARIFVVWTRAETPNGVIVNLDSPGTGALGEAGVGGFADTHFLDRFGAAILVSLIQSGASAAAARLGGATRGTNVFLAGPASATNDVVAKTYENTINMPPTVYVNQGERVSVFVARDLNFRSVYGLEPVHRDDE
jgi:type IV secretion system protein VirB10